MRSEFRRRDLVVALSVRDGEAVATVSVGDWKSAVALGGVGSFQPQGPYLPPSPLLETIDRYFAAWLASEDMSERSTDHPSDAEDTTVLHRLALDIRSRALAVYDWEASVGPFVQARAISSGVPVTDVVVVRTLPVVPRVAAVPFTYPIRVLDVDVGTGRGAASPMADMVASLSDDSGIVFDAAEATAGTIEETRHALQWPRADILHFGIPPFHSDPDELFTTGNPNRSGTLGWLSRLTETWQVRLVTIECWSASEFATARAVAWSLASRGGPAVLLRGPETQDSLDEYYRSLVHDWPLDAAVGRTLARIPPPRAGVGSVCLMAGSGREELLRVSNVALELMSLTDATEGAAVVVRTREAEELVDVLERAQEEGAEPATQLATPAEIHDHLVNNVRGMWEKVNFKYHESHGLYPTARALTTLRRMTRAQPQPMPKRGVGTRFINPRLGRASVSGVMRALDQTAEQLKIGDVYQALIQVGPRDETIQVYGAAALIEEVFKWGPDVEGHWLEVAITGIDFEVIGDPVQELWLPREGASEEIAFAIVPSREGVGRLRIGIYFDQDLLQSFRIAAVVTGTNGIRVDQRTQLAKALDVPPAAIPDVTYLPRLEYSIAPSADAFKKRPRTLSFIVNDSDGKPWVTVKGKDRFIARTDSNIPDLVIEAREALDRASVDAARDEDPAKKPYAFEATGRNVGTPDQLDRAFRELAAAGWRLFAQMLGSDGERLGQELEGEQATIHVAHILLPKVIPWSLVYDRRYDYDRQTFEGKAVGHATCRAPLVAEDAPSRCGTHPQCLLSPGRKEQWEKENDKVLRSDTVACPLHFWGFRHVIELPPMQVGPDQEADELWECVLVRPPVHISGGLNTLLQLAASHSQDIDTLTRTEPIKGTIKWARNRDDVVDDLDSLGADVVYLYCHAQGGPSGASKNQRTPVLLFAGAGGGSGKIEAAQIGAGHPAWPHRPLVFLNGCRTAGFTPDALSPFIETFVRDRRAAGVIGTEISVWEQVATEIATRFLGGFLTGKPAGEALLEARRGLLVEKNNPLGLCYTLYASADLALDLDGDGNCPRPDDASSAGGRTASG